MLLRVLAPVVLTAACVSCVGSIGFVGLIAPHMARLLLRGGPVHYQGETVSIAGAQLEFEPFRADIPVHLGVTGPKALELAGEIADGAMLNGFLPPDYVRRARARTKSMLRSPMPRGGVFTTRSNAASSWRLAIRRR